MKYAAILVAASWALWTLPVAAEEAPARPAVPEIEALRTCRAIADVPARAACYDAATDALLSAARGRDIVVINKDEVRKTRRGLFGFALPRIPFLDGSGRGKDADAVDKLQTRIASVARAGFGKFRFTVEDGARWETVEPSSRLAPLEVGQPITLEKGLFGAYFLVAGQARVQARRLPEN